MHIATVLGRCLCVVIFGIGLNACSDSEGEGNTSDGGAPSGDGGDGTSGASGATSGNGGASGSTSGDPDGGGSGTSGGDGDGGSGVDPNAPAAPGVPPTFATNFPGAGTSGDDAPLTNGELCDYVPLNGAPTPNELTTCFFSPGDPNPAATMEQVLECVDGQDVVHIRLTFNPSFVDNSYGENSIGWRVPDPNKPRGGGRGGHSFDDLVGSDHAEIILTNDSGDTAAQFKLDYISEDASAASGYAALGVTGGEGEMIVGDPAWIIDAQSSFALNLNERGYDEGYFENSPASDADYTPNPDAPEWDFRVVYEAWIDVAAFGDEGFGTALIEFVHASPSKADSNTLIVEPGECPCVELDGSCGDTPPDDEPPPGNDWCESMLPDDIDCPDEVCTIDRPDDIDCGDGVCDVDVTDDVDCGNDICNPLATEDVDCDRNTPPPGDGVCILDRPDIDCRDDHCDPTRPDDADCSDDMCEVDRPDIDCGTSYPPPPPDEVVDCLDTPELPACNVD